MISVHGLVGVVAAVHADVVLLVHAIAVDRRADELVDTEADVLVLGSASPCAGPCSAAPGLRVVSRLEQAHALDDRPEAVVVLRVEHQRGDPEMSGRLVCRVVPLIAAGLALKGRELRPGHAAVRRTRKSPGISTRTAGLHGFGDCGNQPRLLLCVYCCST